MKILEKGGNAFDAAAAAGFVLNVVEPHLNGPLGDMPMLIKPAADDEPTMVCGQGPAPSGATIAHYRDLGLTRIPGTGFLAAVVPGAFDAWMITLRDYGSLTLRDILEPAIHYADKGHPVLPRVANTIAGLSDFFQQEWPSSFDTWLPNGAAPVAGQLMRNPQLADTWQRLLDHAETVSDRVQQIELARQAFYRGFIAETIDEFVGNTSATDASGRCHKGVLTAQDMANWQAHYEPPLSTDYHGWSIWKGGAWTQGPTLLQTLNILSGFELPDSTSERFVHLTVEAMKLGFADREAYYGDPLQTEIPTAQLLSAEYAEQRRKLIADAASAQQRPGRLPGYEAWADAAVRHASEQYQPSEQVGSGEPTMAHLTEKRGDTVHLDVIDRWGNMVSATPSGGWLQSSPVIPGLGMPLNTRAQMFWLEDGLPNSLAPGRRPRTTLSPTMARAPDGRELAFGTPGGDQQDQWQLIYLLRLVHQKVNLQEAIDAPLFHTAHFQSSFYPREVRPRHLMIEPGFGDGVVNDLRKRGHDVEVAEPWSVGRLTAASRSVDGLLNAAATPRLMQAYAIGR